MSNWKWWSSLEYVKLKLVELYRTLKRRTSAYKWSNTASIRDQGPHYLPVFHFLELTRSNDQGGHNVNMLISRITLTAWWLIKIYVRWLSSSWTLPHNDLVHVSTPGKCKQMQVGNMISKQIQYVQPLHSSQCWPHR